jgi:hypothetical protein
MNSKELLLDFLQVYKDGIHATLKDLPAEAFVWQPDPEANHLAATLWHISRLLDMGATMRLNNKPIDDELWFTNGWLTKTGYDPRGLGMRGWGVLIGYSVPEMKAVPILPPTDALAYYDECHAAYTEIIRALPVENLQEKAPGGDPQRSYYEWTRIYLTDGMRHTGEIQAIKAMWERKHVKREA